MCASGSGWGVTLGPRMCASGFGAVHSWTYPVDTHPPGHTHTPLDTHTPVDPPTPRRNGQQAGGTHPTGMLSYLSISAVEINCTDQCTKYEM